MKTLLLILLICSNLIAAPDCFKNYASAMDKVEKIYKKAQFQHSLIFKDQYVYEIYPTMMFPLFCAPAADTIKKILPYGIIYLCGTTIGLHLDKDNIKHISIAILQYIKIGNNSPVSKVYAMYFFKMDSTIKDWIEERPPVIVTMHLKNDGSYMSK